MSVFSTDFQQSQNIWHVCAVWTYHTFSFFDASSLYFEDQRTIFGKYLCILEPSFEKKIIWPFRKFYPVFRKQSQISQLIFNSLRFLNWFSTVSAQLGCVCHLDTPYFFVFCCLHVLFWRPMDYFTQIFMYFGSLIWKRKISVTFEKI